MTRRRDEPVADHQRQADPGAGRPGPWLAEAAEAADGMAPLSEHALLHLRYDAARPGRGRRPEHGRRHSTGAGQGTDRDLVLTTAQGEMAGYAHVDANTPARDLSGELVIHPRHRGHGLGLALVRALIAAAADTSPLWAHGDLPAAAALARAAGFERFRALWQMRRPLADPLDPPVFPAGQHAAHVRPGPGRGRVAAA